MNVADRYFTRRNFMTAAGAGTLAAALPRRLGAAEPTAAERANIELVNGFCAGWKVPLDWDRLGAALAADCRFRPTQTMPVVAGRDAIIAMLQDFAREATAAEFEVVDSWARGPIVVNDRIGPLRPARQQHGDPRRRRVSRGRRQDRRVERLHVLRI